MKADTVVVSLIVAVVLVTGGAIMYLNAPTGEAGGYGVHTPTYVRSSTAAEGSLNPVGQAIMNCYDTDGGKNYELKGTLTIGRSTWTDVCDQQSGQLVENWCMYNARGQPYRGWATVDCSQGRCVDGACILEI